MACRAQHSGLILGNKNVFDLEKEIANWKAMLGGEGAINTEENLELESHLRESVAGLEAKGLSAEESFLIARNRMGHPVALQQEFVKNRPSRAMGISTVLDDCRLPGPQGDW